MELNRYIATKLFLQDHAVGMGHYYVIDKEKLIDSVTELVPLTDIDSVYDYSQVKYIVSDNTGRVLLAKYNDEVCSTSKLASLGRYNWEAELTEEEIEQYDHNYMVFAKKIEE